MQAFSNNSNRNATLNQGIYSGSIPPFGAKPVSPTPDPVSTRIPQSPRLITYAPTLASPVIASTSGPGVSAPQQVQVANTSVGITTPFRQSIGNLHNLVNTGE